MKFLVFDSQDSPDTPDSQDFFSGLAEGAGVEPAPDEFRLLTVDPVFDDEC